MQLMPSCRETSLFQDSSTRSCDVYASAPSAILCVGESFHTFLHLSPLSSSLWCSFCLHLSRSVSFWFLTSLALALVLALVLTLVLALVLVLVLALTLTLALCLALIFFALHHFFDFNFFFFLFVDQRCLYVCMYVCVYVLYYILLIYL